MCCFFFFLLTFIVYIHREHLNLMQWAVSVQIFGKYILPLGGKCYHPAGNANLKLYIP